MNMQDDLSGVIVDAPTLIGLRQTARDVSLRTKERSRSSVDGSSRSSRRGRGMEFSEVRHYQPGDDIRNIDWRVTARTQETYTKLFQEEKERPVYLLVDQRNSMFFGSKTQFKSVLAAKIAATIAWAAFANRDRLGALIFGSNTQSDQRPKLGKATLFRFIQDLSEYNSQLIQSHQHIHHDKDSKQSLSNMVSELQRVARPGSSVFIISDFHDFDQHTIKALSLLRRHNEVSLLQVFDPFESHLPDLGRFSISSGAKKALINTSSAQFRQNYLEAWSESQHSLQTESLKTGIRLHQFNTHLPFNDQVKRVLGSGKGRPL